MHAIFPTSRARLLLRTCAFNRRTKRVSSPSLIVYRRGAVLSPDQYPNQCLSSIPDRVAAIQRLHPGFAAQDTVLPFPRSRYSRRRTAQSAGSRLAPVGRRVRHRTQRRVEQDRASIAATPPRLYNCKKSHSFMTTRRDREANHTMAQGGATIPLRVPSGFPRYSVPGAAAKLDFLLPFYGGSCVRPVRSTRGNAVRRFLHRFPHRTRSSAVRSYRIQLARPRAMRNHRVHCSRASRACEITSCTCPSRCQCNSSPAVGSPGVRRVG